MNEKPIITMVKINTVPSLPISYFTRYMYLETKYNIITITAYEIIVVYAAPIIPNLGIKIKFNPTFTNAPVNVAIGRYIVFSRKNTPGNIIIYKP